MTSRRSSCTHDVVDAAAGVADQRLHGGAANGKKADEMLWRGNTVISLIRASSVWPVLGEPGDTRNRRRKCSEWQSFVRVVDRWKPGLLKRR